MSTRTRITTRLFNCLNKSMTYCTKTNSLTTSAVKSGSVYLDRGKVLVTASVPNVITYADLNRIEMARSPLTVNKYNEHKAVEYALRSLCQKSVYEGHGNSVIYKEIHNIIQALISGGYLPEDCYLGRMPFAGIKSMMRAAISVDPGRLHRVRDLITIFAINHGYDPEELLRVLFFCSVNAASNGVFEFESLTCQKTFIIVRALPASTRKQVLEGRYKSVRLFSAV